ncbi:helix-turn-helix domain-containing protein [Halobacteria archaeon AArc-m2/3/4]|uniref:Helix-turn-helix domain-containing protein n=1 Tax=Natronoglomus mannanivorans TaxID=2979990 RepID=A0ABT2QB88_9EURY|nr:helix-turn-helix domain-containing protein [Halobacteria archaeon AArc-m2/3/4]
MSDMQYARVRIGASEPSSQSVEETPVTALAAADGVDGVHLLAGGVADTDAPTYSLSIAGSEDAVRTTLEDDPTVLEWEISSAEAGTVYAYVRFRAPPAVGALREHLTRDSLVVLLPATFRPDGAVELTVVGSQSDLSTAFDDLPEGMRATVLEVGPYRGGRLHRGTGLTDHQRETLRTAYELGYYETPSRASHEEIAAELDCASSTVGEHLRKAEARLVAELFE